MTSIVNCRNGRIFLSDLREAQGHWQKFAGLMFAPSLGNAQGILFRPAQGVHTHFMRFSIDLVYLDAANRVRAIREAMPPWRLDLRTAAAVIEANAGAARAADIQIGDELRIETRQIASARSSRRAPSHVPVSVGSGIDGSELDQDSGGDSPLTCPAGIKNVGTSEPSMSIMTARSPVDSVAGVRKAAATVAPGARSCGSEHD